VIRKIPSSIPVTRFDVTLVTTLILTTIVARIINVILIPRSNGCIEGGSIKFGVTPCGGDAAGSIEKSVPGGKPVRGAILKG
jgi:hypothetical protein